MRPIFQQCANLYPVIKPIADLCDYDRVVAKCSLIKAAFSVPMTEPRHIPVTLDLSRAEREMPLRRLDSPIRSLQETPRPDGRRPRG